MNITKEQMLERIREWKGAFDTHPDKMDEWSLCFMEDYKVYDAIRSLIESSGEKAVPASDRLTAPCENDPMPAEVDVEYWRKITSEADKRNTAPVQKGTHLSTSVEVEEAIKHAAEFRLGLWVEFLKMPGLDKELDPLLWNESDEAALAVIRAALTATIKPPLTVAQTTKVTREWVSWFVKTLFDMKMRGVTFPVEGAAETMLQSVGIEVEP